MKKALKEKLQARLHKALEPPRAVTPKQDNSDAIVTRYASSSETSLVNSAPPKVTSLDTNTQQDQPMASLVNMTRLADMTGLNGTPLDLMSSLPDSDGYTKLWHQMTDHLYGQLTTTEQAVHIQLFRLSWGFNKSSCLIALPKLAQRTNSSERTVQRALEGLIKKGLVKKARVIQGRDKIQGIEYEVTPPPSLAKSARQAKMTSLDKMATNKWLPINEVLKETIKNGSVASLDIKNCPDCHGTGFSYPNGHGGGVVKCKHEGLHSPLKEVSVSS